ncbi:MAG: hypothetical protein KA746_12970 [Pyrinomonadaceae bacterium]|nr:hypothetical protein [Pyrinomonadaceae bacterium]MBP6214309.1 hypothetical protein [Pyrinomonadaceae bacterium]
MREPQIRGDRLCNTLYYSPGDSWDKIEEEDSEPPADSGFSRNIGGFGLLSAFRDA